MVLLVYDSVLWLWCSCQIVCVCGELTPFVPSFLLVFVVVDDDDDDDSSGDDWDDSWYVQSTSLVHLPLED